MSLVGLNEQEVEEIVRRILREEWVDRLELLRTKLARLEAQQKARPKC